MAAWTASNSERAGATTDTLMDAQCLYLPIRSKDAVFGVAGIVMDDEGDDDFGAFEKNLLLMIVDECGQASEQIAFADERRTMELRVEKGNTGSNLLRTISHDLRTPLTSISGDADMLLHDDGKLDEELKARLYRDMHDDACWLIALVENLLSITRIDDGTVELAMQPEFVGEVVGGALPPHRPPRPEQANRRGHRRRIPHGRHGRAPRRPGDDQPREQRGGLHARRRAHPRVRTPCRRDGNPRVSIAVADEGPGISEEEREHLFDMFYNGSNGSKGGKSGDFKRGMGLGLSLCRSIVNVHGSELEVRNRSPHGSEFPVHAAGCGHERRDGGGRRGACGGPHEAAESEEAGRG